jgi:hypothetical protein
MTYGVSTKVVRPTHIADERDIIPLDVLRAIDVTLDAPERLSIGEKIPATLRARVSPDLADSHENRIKFMGFKMDVVQCESYVYVSS